MKKLIFVLAMFIAASAYAVDVTLVDNGDGSVDIQYSNGTPVLPRAFALDITTSGASTITSVTNYFVGECNETTQGFGIYPATIVVDSEGDISDWGNPLADGSDPGAGDQVMPSNHFVLEFASLYVDPNAPATSGTLCTLTYDCGGDASVTITMIDEDVYRGGVVLEDGTSVDVSDSLVATATCEPPECYKDTSPSYAAWKDTFGMPDCWCYQRQCRGDADGLKAGLYWVYTNDLNVLKGAYQKNDTTLKNIVVNGVKGICADFDHTKSGLYRVYTADLNILKTYYQKSQTIVTVCDVNLVNFWTN